MPRSRSRTPSPKRTTRKLSDYNKFVKAEMLKMRTSNPDLSAPEKMKIIGRKWSKSKE